MANLQHCSCQTLAYKSDIKWYCSESGRNWSLKALQQFVKILDESTGISLEWLLLIVFWNKHQKALPEVPPCRAQTERWPKYGGKLARIVARKGESERGKCSVINWAKECKCQIARRGSEREGVHCKEGEYNLPNRPFLEKIGNPVFPGGWKTKNLKIFEYLQNGNFKKDFLFRDERKSKIFKFIFWLFFQREVSGLQIQLH